MPEKKLHIISFDIPFPANYGGIIDVFYKIKFLRLQGVKIHLHCFEYGREHTNELNKYCEEVHYYKRKTSLLSHFSLKPYIVYSRRSELLIKRLLQDNAPILMEGLHSCYFINDKRLKGRKVIFRESNIEHEYYIGLMREEKNVIDKLFFAVEAIKLKRFEKQIAHASLALTVSEEDKNYFLKKYPLLNVINLPSFHANESVNCKNGKGDYLLYHGNLSIQENTAATEFIVTEIAPKINFPIIIAGLNPPEKIKQLIATQKNVQLIENPDDNKLFGLIQNAHINFLYTKQATGLKLKLLNALFNGRFCLVNSNMLHGVHVHSLCTVANGSNEIANQIEHLSKQAFTNELSQQRKEVLLKDFSAKKNAEKLWMLIEKI